MKVIVAVVGILLPLLQQQKENPDLKYDPKMGISVAKPPKNDEWDFKEKGFFTKYGVNVQHVSMPGSPVMIASMPAAKCISPIAAAPQP
jgi:hypothetical protein